MAADASQDDRGECTPCHGTGSLISNKGGTAHQVKCPWCGGTGQFSADRDAQEFAAEADGS